ncbi:protein translocase subunit SecD [Streptomyces sp. NPDC005385]|uniref:protein translocase subunit SecD n=1 Tax=Streptomyces sp. NPDC005385 TaxID=3157039 RepID=UPI0033BB491D
MPGAPRIRALISLAIIALSLAVALTVPLQLGLDLRGGTQIVLETRPPSAADAGAGTAAGAGSGPAGPSSAADRTVEVLRGRVDALGVSEATIVRSGSDRIVVELPGVQDPRHAADLLGRTAQLTIHPVLGIAAGPDDTPAPLPKRPHQQVLPDESGALLRLRAPALTGTDVASADALFDGETGAGWHVAVDFKGAGRDGWARLTGAAACLPAGDPARRVAIVLDGKVISSPQVDPSVPCGSGIGGGATRISGSFDGTEARELALLIQGGALPVPVETVEQRVVGPSLGAEAIRAGAWAAVIGTALTALFIGVTYRLVGVLATVALACYGLISYAALAAIGATLTLPGLAGFVLAIGMAVDANVLVFERAREEYASRERATPRSSLTAGFRGAFSAIADSNVTTLIAAGLLFFLASGPVRGFGVTLGIGVLASMVSALVVTRALAENIVARPWARRRPRLTGIAHTGRVRDGLHRWNPRPMRRPRRWLAGSAVALVLAASGVAVRGLDLGVEFTGGRLVEYATTTPVGSDRLRGALAEAGFPHAVVQSAGGDRIIVRTGPMTNAQAASVSEVVKGLAPRAETVRDESIGPSLGRELRQGALIALGVALAAQLVYLAARFRWLLGTSAVVALTHDVVILLGVFAWWDKPVDGVFLAALLTVIGYSVNDSVVVFDRIRELRRLDGAAPFSRTADRALLQTLPRTVNTGLGAAFILTTLAVFGGEALTDFALALLVGLAVGTYSSMFVATPLAIELGDRLPAGTRVPSSGRPAAER